MNARLSEAISACVILAIVALRRLSFTEASIFGLAIFFIYLPGYIVYNHILKEKGESIEAHIASLAIGITLIIITSFAAMQLGMKPSFITSIIIEASLLFIIGNVIMFKGLHERTKK